MRGEWTSAMVAGHPVDCYEPPGAPAGLGVIFLHGIGCETLVDRPAFTRWFDELRLRCFCPQAGPTWWTARITQAFDPAYSVEEWLRGQVLPWLAAERQIAPPRLGLLGISMGGQAALRWGFQFPEAFPVVAGISSAIEYHLNFIGDPILEELYTSKEQCRQDTALLRVNPLAYPPAIWFCCDPTDYPWYRGNDRLHEKLSALGIAHECDLSTLAGGHSWDYFDAMAERAVRFMHGKLIEQSRRLL